MSKTILVAEDNENNMMLVRDVLQMKGYTVLEATTGAEGVRLAVEHKPDLILMDIQLPDIDGITVLAQIRANEATKSIPMLAVSASVMPEEQQQIVASGFDAFIKKPLSMKSFIETVERFIGKA
jgi:two-component system cell cycle response regulator DivK